MTVINKVPTKTQKLGVLRISSDGDDQMAAEIKTQKKSLGLPTLNPPQKSLDQKSTSKKNPHALFSTLEVLKIFHKAVNDKVQKINQELNVCLSSRIHRHNQEDTVCFEYPEKSLLESSYPKKTCQISQNRKFQTPKNSIDHPRHLKFGVPLLG